MWKYFTDEVLIWGLIGLFWAIVHATSHLKTNREKKLPFTWVDFLILVCIAAFGWGIFWLVWMLLFQNVFISWLCSGIGWFLGLTWLNQISDVVLDLLKHALSSNKTSNDKSDQ